MTSTKPYFIRALYDWIVDNNCTPHIVVDTRDERCKVPTQFIKNNTIVLNVAPSAVRHLELGAETVSFGARFSGTPYEIVVPVAAIRAIYARENNQGLAFEEETNAVTDTPSAEEVPSDTPKAPKKAPHLTIVK